MPSSSTSPCAGCKLLRRKCRPDCIFAPYFPPEQPKKFQNVHRVFGATNVGKMLTDMHPSQREDAVNSLAYEADMRLRDPVYGCVGVISILHQQLNQLRADLSIAKSELLKFQTLTNQGILANATTAATTASASNHHHRYVHQRQHLLQQQQKLSLNLIGGGDQFYQQNFQFYPRDQPKQMIRSSVVGGNYDGSFLASMNGGVGQVSQFQNPKAAGGGDRQAQLEPS